MICLKQRLVASASDKIVTVDASIVLYSHNRKDWGRVWNWVERGWKEGVERGLCSIFLIPIVANIPLPLRTFILRTYEKEAWSPTHQVQDSLALGRHFYCRSYSPHNCSRPAPSQHRLLLRPCLLLRCPGRLRHLDILHRGKCWCGLPRSRWGLSKSSWVLVIRAISIAVLLLSSWRSTTTGVSLP